MSKSTKPSRKTEVDVHHASSTSSAPLADIAKLLEEHRASMAADFKTTFAALELRLDKMQATVTEHSQRMGSLESNADLQDQRLQTLEEKCAALAESNKRLMVKAADLEGRSRRNNIRIIGLPESIEGPRPSKFFADLLVEVLGDQVLDSPPELDRAHRTGAAKPQPGSRPRPVIICLHRHQTKELIIREARKRRGTLQYHGSPVQIFEDYAPEVAEERAKYRAVMADLYNLALRPALLFPARLQITLRSGERRRFSSPEEASTFVANFKQAPGSEHGSD